MNETADDVVPGLRPLDHGVDPGDAGRKARLLAAMARLDEDPDERARIGALAAAAGLPGASRHEAGRVVDLTGVERDDLPGDDDLPEREISPAPEDAGDLSGVLASPGSHGAAKGVAPGDQLGTLLARQDEHLAHLVERAEALDRGQQEFSLIMQEYADRLAAESKARRSDRSISKRRGERGIYRSLQAAPIIVALISFLAAFLDWSERSSLVASFFAASTAIWVAGSTVILGFSVMRAARHAESAQGILRLLLGSRSADVRIAEARAEALAAMTRPSNSPEEIELTFKDGDWSVTMERRPALRERSSVKADLRPVDLTPSDGDDPWL
jgi:hypothetical protein